MNLENVLLKNERLDFLLAKKLRIIQSTDVFSFSLDAVLLAHFSQIPKRKGKIIDLCSGTGVIPLLLSERTEALISAIEIQPRLADMARRSVKYNQLEKQIKIYEQDLRAMTTTFAKESADVVTCNPPYFATTELGRKNKNEYVAIARHEIMCTLKDVIQTASELVKQGGKVCLVHRPERLVDMIDMMRNFRLEPKRIQFVHPKLKQHANMVLIEGLKDGKPGAQYLSPILVHDSKQYYSKEVQDILYG